MRRAYCFDLDGTLTSEEILPRIAKEIDLLSIDLDGNDFHIFESISVIKTRVVILEYNGKFSPTINYCMSYNANHTWDNNDNYGASLKFLEINLKKIGYVLVACNITGINAFFVREDLTKSFFQEPFTAENHYQSGIILGRSLLQRSDSF